jgi:hypothetical protein
MYWLLLPVDANPGRDLTSGAPPSRGVWARLWAALMDRLNLRA